MVADPLTLPITLEPSLAAPREARRLLTTWLTANGCAHPLQDDALVIVSELVTNAVVHARTRVTIVAKNASDASGVNQVVRLEVHDAHSSVPGTTARSGSAGGRGLDIVAGLAERWGCDPTPQGKSVWAEIVC